MCVTRSPQQTATSNSTLHRRAYGQRAKSHRNQCQRQKCVRHKALAAVAGQEVFSTGQKRATHRMIPIKTSRMPAQENLGAPAPPPIRRRIFKIGHSVGRQQGHGGQSENDKLDGVTEQAQEGQQPFEGSEDKPVIPQGQHEAGQKNAAEQPDARNDGAATRPPPPEKTTRCPHSRRRSSIDPAGR